MSRAECKKCIHLEVCDKVDFPIFNGGKCTHYKDKSLCIELPCRCEECIYFQCDKVLLSDGTYRDYTEEEIKNGKCVTLDVGINAGSRCMRIWHWERNDIPVWFDKDDYCSYGRKKLKEIERK